MSHLSVELNLEHALLWVFDPDGEFADLADVDPAEIAMLAEGSILTLAGQHEVDGTTRLDVYIDEVADLAATPLHIGEGLLSVVSGSLAVSGSPSLQPEAQVEVTPGRYEIVVYGQERLHPEHLTVALNRIQS